jgi:fatty-acyl-CoA synthase
MGWMNDETGLEKRAANFVPLTPLSHLQRAARVFPEDEAVVYGTFRKTYAQYHERVTRLASGLAKMGVAPGEVVATLLPNIPAHAEAHFGVPACGAVLNTINTRLEAETIAYILDHGEAKVLLVDPQFLGVVKDAISRMEGPAPTLVEVADEQAGMPAHGSHMEYEDLLATGDPDFEWIMPEDEWESLALNYTSGTTGRPKGVVYHHRGAYLMTMGTAISWPFPRGAKYLTIVPLFHCNNWNHTWMAPMVGGTVVCCRDITAKAIYDAIADEGVTHFGAAPIVLNTIVNAKDAERRPFDHVVEVFTAGAPPPAATLAAIEPLGFHVTQVYGLTETYGHVTECLWHKRWDAEQDEERYAIKARTGVAMPMAEDITALDPESMGRSRWTPPRRARS